MDVAPKWVVDMIRSYKDSVEVIDSGSVTCIQNIRLWP